VERVNQVLAIRPYLSVMDTTDALSQILVGLETREHSLRASAKGLHNGLRPSRFQKDYGADIRSEFSNLANQLRTSICGFIKSRTHQHHIHRMASDAGNQLLRRRHRGHDVKIAISFQ